MHTLRKGVCATALVLASLAALPARRQGGQAGENARGDVRGTSVAVDWAAPWRPDLIGRRTPEPPIHLLNWCL